MGTRCFIALGSNLNHPMQQVTRATVALDNIPQTRLKRVSPWYQSTAVGPGIQDDYINGVAELFTDLTAQELLQELHKIENNQLRERIQHWGPRTLDLDLLLYGQEIIQTHTLVVPHPRMLERNFVLYPLFDIASDLLLPDGGSLKQHYQQCSADNLVQIDKNTAAIPLESYNGAR